MDVKCYFCHNNVTADNFGAMRLRLSYRAAWVYMCDVCYERSLIDNDPKKTCIGLPNKNNRSKEDINRYLSEAQPYTNNPYGIEINDGNSEFTYYIKP